MKNRRPLILLALLLLATLAGCASLPKTSPEFDVISKDIKSIAVMPVSFSIVEVASFSNQAISEITHDIEIEIKRATEEVVAASPYQLTFIDAADETLAAYPELMQHVFAQHTELSQVNEKLATVKGKTIDIDYAADIDYFADLSGTEYFFFVQGSGWFKTTGAQVKEAVVATALAVLFGGGPNVGPESNTRLRGYLVDAQRGKVVWYNEVSEKNNDPRKPSYLSKVCQKLLKPLLGKVTIKPDKSRDKVIIEKYKAVTGEPAAEDEPTEEKTKTPVPIL